MKKLMLLLVLAALFCAYGDELLKNGSFREATSAALPREWKFSDPAGCSLKDGVLTLKNEGSRKLVIQQRNLPLVPGRKYEFSYSVRSEQSSPYRIYCEWVRKNAAGEREYKSSGGKFVTASPEWRKVSFRFTYPERFEPAYAVINMREAGTLELKELNLVPLDESDRKEFGGVWKFRSGSGMEQIDFKEMAMVKGGSRAHGAALREVSLEPGETYEFSYTARGFGDSGDITGYHRFRVNVLLNGDSVGLSSWEDTWVQSGQLKKLSFKAPETLKNAKADFLFSVMGKGRVGFYDFKLTQTIPLPADQFPLILESPPYRNMIFSSLPVDHISGYVPVDNTVKSVAASLYSGEKLIASAQMENKDGRAAFSFKAAGLAVGKYTLTITIHAAQTIEKKTIIEKMAPAPIEVVQGADRNFYINGEFFFPVIFWNIPPEEHAIYQAAANGINLCMRRPSSEADALKSLDTAGMLGMKLIFNLRYAKDPDGEQFRNWAHNLENILTPKVLSHPALFGYFLVDESSWLGVPLKSLLASYAKYKQLDPYRPVWINAAPRGTIEEQREYSRACDIYGVDIYPVPYPNQHSGLDDKGITSVGKYAERSWNITEKRKAIWLALQGFAWGEDPGNSGPCFAHPTLRETRFMAYDALLNQANSVGWWGVQHVKTPEFFDTLFQATSELREMSGVLAAGKKIPGKYSANSGLKCTMFEHASGKCLIVMNVTGEAITGELAIPGFSGQLEVIREKRKVDAVNGIFKDEFAPYDVHVYAAGKLPQPLYRAPAFDEKAEKTKFFHTRAEVLNSMKSYEGKANWIWDAKLMNTPNSKVLLAKSFHLDAVVKDAAMKFAADDCCTVIINGRELGQSNTWDTMEYHECGSFLRPGENLIVIEARDTGKLPCGVIAELTVHTAADKEIIINTDNSWFATGGEDGTKIGIQDISGWEKAGIAAPAGQGRWGKNLKEKIRKGL